MQNPLEQSRLDCSAQALKIVPPAIDSSGDAFGSTKTLASSELAAQSPEVALCFDREEQTVTLEGAETLREGPGGSTMRHAASRVARAPAGPDWGTLRDGKAGALVDSRSMHASLSLSFPPLLSLCLR